jgi:hypothetical protein
MLQALADHEHRGHPSVHPKLWQRIRIRKRKVNEEMHHRPTSRAIIPALLHPLVYADFMERMTTSHNPNLFFL